MEIFVVVVLEKGDILIPCLWILVFVHLKYVHDHPINDFCMAISLGVQGSRLGEPGVQQ